MLTSNNKIVVTPSWRSVIPNTNIVYRGSATVCKCGKYFNNFGVRKEIAPIYGCRSEDVMEIEFIISDDQSIPSKDDKSIDTPDYWGWYSFADGKFTKIYPKRHLLEIGLKHRFSIDYYEKRRIGKAYRINVITPIPEKVSKECDKMVV